MSALANRDFVKMNGLGNEIVIVDLRRERRAAIGAAEARAAARQEPYDQLMALYPARGGSDASIRIYNNDGSEAGACGNGMRCVAALVSDETGKAELKFETAAGANLLLARGRGGCSRSTWAGRVCAGTRFRWPGNSPTRARSNSNGPPACRSCIRRRPSAWAIRTRSSGSTIRRPTISPRSGRCSSTIRCFRERANITLAATPSRDRIVIRTWERGAGLTKACGSAACAAAVAAARLDAPAAR